MTRRLGNRSRLALPALVLLCVTACSPAERAPQPESVQDADSPPAMAALDAEAEPTLDPYYALLEHERVAVIDLAISTTDDGLLLGEAEGGAIRSGRGKSWSALRTGWRVRYWRQGDRDPTEYYLADPRREEGYGAEGESRAVLRPSLDWTVPLPLYDDTGPRLVERIQVADTSGRIIIDAGLDIDLDAGEVSVSDPSGSTEDQPSGEDAPGHEDDPMGVLAFDHTAQKGTGTLVIGQGQEPETLYRYGGSMLAATHIQNSLYESIEGLSFDYQPVILTQLPKLENEGSGATIAMVAIEAGDQYIDPETQEVVMATETIEDLPQLTVEFEMVDGVTWQDGTPVKAEDSVFAYNLSCDPDTATSKYLCERTAAYEATGESTVQWTGLPGYTDQTYFTNFTSPLPRHQPGSEGTPMEEMSAIDIAEDEQFTRNPWSYGPFMIEEWSDGDFIRLVRNENYWRADEGLPILDSVIHKFIQDSNSLLAALRTGDIDVATQDGLDISQFDALEDGMNAGEITPYYVVGTVWEHIDFNFDPVDDRPAIGACKDVRKAMAYATDRETMVDVIQQGKTKVQNTYVPDVHWAYPPEDMLTTYPYELETAAQLLEDLGFVDDDGDVTTPRVAAEDITCTITTDIEGNTKDQVIPAGTPLELSLNTTQGNVMREETTLLFQQNMAEVGIRVLLEYSPSNVLFGDGPDGPLFGRRFDLGEFAWLTGVQPSVGLYYCTEIPSEDNSWGGQNATGFCHPEYDRIAKRAENTLARPTALPLYHEAQKIFSDELPVLPLFARVKVMATRPNVVNFRPDPTVNSETWNIETWGFAGESAD